MQITPLVMTNRLPGATQNAQLQPVSRTQPITDASERASGMTIICAGCAIITSLPFIMIGSTAAGAANTSGLSARDRASLAALSVTTFCFAGYLILHGAGMFRNISNQLNETTTQPVPSDTQAQELDDIPTDQGHIAVELPDGSIAVGFQNTPRL